MIREARRLLGWPQHELSSRVKISLNTLNYTESGKKTARSSTLQRIRSALEAAGVEFIAENGGGAGVRLKKPSPPAIPVEDLNASNGE
jgi:ribosome-binding protein aMBF1 (putative translation factor)